MTNEPKVRPYVNLGYDIDPALYEYDAKEVADDEVYELMAMRGVSPDVIVSPKERKKYIQFLQTYRPED